jgi:hypothetical protein
MVKLEVLKLCHGARCKAIPTGLVPWEDCSIGKYDIATKAREMRCRRRTARSGADNENVRFDGLGQGSGGHGDLSSAR